MKAVTLFDSGFKLDTDSLGPKFDEFFSNNQIYFLKQQK